MRIDRRNQQKRRRKLWRVIFCAVLICAMGLSVAVSGFAETLDQIPDGMTQETPPEETTGADTPPIPETTPTLEATPTPEATPTSEAMPSPESPLAPEQGTQQPSSMPSPSVGEEEGTSQDVKENPLEGSFAPAEEEQTEVPPVEDKPAESVTQAPPAWVESGQKYLKNNLLLAENIRVLRGILDQKIEEAKAGNQEAAVNYDGEDNMYDIIALYAVIKGQQNVFPFQVDIRSEEDVQTLRGIFEKMTEVKATKEGVQVSYKGYMQVAAEYGLSTQQMTVLTDLMTSGAKQQLRQIEETSILTRLTDEEFEIIYEKLPERVYGEQRAVLLAALSIEGKVSYFWGGKSYYTGWDERWGQLRTVSSEGSETTGTVRPFGLDCSGFVSWAFINAGGDKEVLEKIGNGTASQWENSFDIQMDEAQPGDLLFYRSPGGQGINHVGIVVGRNEDGKLEVVHCSSSQNSVVVTDDTGFQYARRPYVYAKDDASATVAAQASLETPMSITGANDTVMNQNMVDWAPLAGNSDWINYLNNEWNNVKGNFRWDNALRVPEDWKWDGRDADPVAGGTPDENPAAIPVKNGTIWEVYSGQQLRYAFLNMIDGDTVALQRDIDLRGYEYNWEPIVLDAGGNSNITIDGRDFTIYNLGCNNGSMLQGNSGGEATITGNSRILHINFISAKIMSKPAVGTLRHLGIVERIGTGKIENTTVKNSLFFSGYYDPNQPAIGADGYLSPFGFTETVSSQNYYTMNNLLYARQYHVGGSFARLYGTALTIENCFSVDSIVVSGYEHSGGFLSCIDGGVTVRNCFTNNTVFGSNTTGVFVGGVYAYQSSLFENCYASGTIEGMRDLGGFAGYAGTYGSTGSIRFKNCYSTSIVGMRNGGSNLGGFIGSYQATVPGVFENCYAAGEVGNIDTNVAPDRIDYTTVGGFIGAYTDLTQLTFTNCYYDKQTTAMREWASGVNFDGNVVIYVDGTDEYGVKHDEYLNILTGELYENDGMNTYISTTDGSTYTPGTLVSPTGLINGLKGVLTSDSEKAGAGLTSVPGTAGFRGFSNAADWVYDGSADGAYPILVSMADELKWGEYFDMVRAYTHASVSTVHLQTWDKCLVGDTLPLLTYDTVRDLTERFTMSTYVEDENDYKIAWQKDGVAVSLDGTNYPVVGYLSPTYLEQYKRNYWMADKFAPGIEWFTVSFTEGSVTGTRRLRIIPTLNFRPGYDRVLSDGNVYDHAKDVRLAYSTGQRMAHDPADITLGIYPDEPLSAEQLQYQGITPTTTFAQEDNKFNNVDTSYITGNPRGTMGQKGDTHYNNNYMRVMLYEATISADGHIQFGEETNIPLTNNNTSDWDKKLNGDTAFTDADLGIYLLDYYWVMPDGRYVHDAKMLYVDEPKTVSVNVVNSDSWKPNPIALMLDVSKGAPDFSAGPRSGVDVANIMNGTQVVAAWKKAEAEAKLNSITFEIKTLFGESSVTMDAPEEGKSMTVTLPYTSLESWNDQGEYYTQVKYVDKTYTLRYDAAGDYYYLTLDNIYSEGRLYAADVDGDIVITLAVTSGYIPPEPTGEPTSEPTGQPTPEPTGGPTPRPTDEVKQDHPKTQDGTNVLFPIFLASVAGAVLLFALRWKKKKEYRS